MAHLIDLRGFVIAMFIIYGVGWLFTSLLSSPTYASLAAFCSLVLVAAGVLAIAAYLGVPMDMSSKDGHEITQGRIAITGLPLAAACFSLGTWNYVQNCER